MNIRTETYIAGDWDHDKKAVDKLYEWKNNHEWTLTFPDAHELTQSKDTSLPCSIKSSLKKRLDVSNRFVLIVGEHTDTVTAGGCQLCGSYNSYAKSCVRGYSTDYRSYIAFECDNALKAYNNKELKIIVLYNSCSVNRNKCPQALRYVGEHIAMGKRNNRGECVWDYDSVKAAFDRN